MTPEIRHALTRPRRVEAIQYDGVCDGPACKAIEAALVRWFGHDGKEDENDARSRLDAETPIVETGGEKQGSDERRPVVHLDRYPDAWETVMLASSDWVVYDVAARSLAVWTDAEWRERVEVTS